MNSQEFLKQLCPVIVRFSNQQTGSDIRGCICGSCNEYAKEQARQGKMAVESPTRLIKMIETRLIFGR